MSQELERIVEEAIKKSNRRDNDFNDTEMRGILSTACQKYAEQIVKDNDYLHCKKQYDAAVLASGYFQNPVGDLVNQRDQLRQENEQLRATINMCSGSCGFPNNAEKQWEVWQKQLQEARVLVKECEQFIVPLAVTRHGMGGELLGKLSLWLEKNKEKPTDATLKEPLKPDVTA